MDAKEKQQIRDEEHLRLLALFHYINGGITILFSSFFIIHVIFMGLMAANAETFMAAEGVNGEEVPSQIFAIFAILVGFFVLLGISFGIAQIISGRFIAQHKNWLFSMIVTVPNILFFPYGSVLGVMTILVLTRDSVKQAYQKVKAS